MQTCKIRPMQINDVSAVLAIERRAHLFPWTKEIITDCIRIGYDCWVLATEDEIQAYAMMSIKKDSGHILSVTVDPAYQRHGNGTQLMQYLMEIAKQKGVSYVFLEVRTSNSSAIKLYEKLGFNQVDIRTKYYPAQQGKEDALVYALYI